MSKLTDLYLLGAGDYGQQLNSFLINKKFFASIKFVDDKLKFKISNFFEKNKKLKFNITISNPTQREKIYKLSINKKMIYQNIILSKKNIYSKNIDKGCIIEPNTLIANNVSLGLGNFIFFGSAIAHNVKIGNFCNINCNVVVSGNTKRIC